MAYVSTKCLSRDGRHCDCVTGPTIQIGGVVKPNRGQSEYCACPCHRMTGEQREELDRQHTGYRDLLLANVKGAVDRAWESASGQQFRNEIGRILDEEGAEGLQARMRRGIERSPHVPWWTVWLWNMQSHWWAVDHWMVTHLFRLNFCPSCSGYFRESGMTLPDKCEACYARDYGVPVPVAE